MYYRFDTPALEAVDREAQLELIRETTVKYGIRAKLKGDEVFKEGAEQPPKFLLKMDHFPKVKIKQEKFQ